MGRGEGGEGGGRREEGGGRREEGGGRREEGGGRRGDENEMNQNARKKEEKESRFPHLILVSPSSIG